MSAPSSAGPTPKGRLRRTALLDAAQRILSSSGGAELTMRTVADEAGVRLGHLQYYFPTRTDLLAALLDRVLTASLERVADLTASPAVDLPAVLDVLLGEHEDLPLVRLFTEVWAMAAHDEAAAEAVRGFYGAYAAHVAELVADRSAGRSATLPPAAARARADVFVMLLEGSALFRSGVAGRPDAAGEALLRRTLLDLLDGGSG
ncbi:TetR/AcrR family transcriptional regulator [Streptomyces sp. NBC_01351]|uniref:TetR/AcrR family transcriptional regulator n=1 Tax=Streptomyces sp. NBC_01351 TaxID=2903833 RepID=UPI002E34DB6A|nr:TetR/AcrR family transcriptional regulator [Streptomyces sp. NBC_01351]